MTWDKTKLLSMSFFLDANGFESIYWRDVQFVENVVVIFIMPYLRVLENSQAMIIFIDNPRYVLQFVYMFHCALCMNKLQ